jgi:hypothetical protein
MSVDAFMGVSAEVCEEWKAMDSGGCSAKEKELAEEVRN